MNATYCVLIADDHVLVREGLRMMLADALAQTGEPLINALHFVEASDANSLFAVARDASPQLLVTDLMMPGMQRGERLSEVARSFPKLAIIVISALTSPDVVRRALAIDNVFAFVCKSANAAEMRAALTAALRREKLSWTPVPMEDKQLATTLSPRLKEVRALLRQGLSNKMIATELGISEGTVKNYMSDIFKALQVSNRTQAAQFNPDAG
jgi:DNA-binding NarL/FixJ family response regulator